MRLLTLTLTALLLAVFALSTVSVGSDVTITAESTLQGRSWDSDPIAAPNLKKDLHLALAPTPIVRFSVALQSSKNLTSFLHYLSVFNQYRERQYFLLV